MTVRERYKKFKPLQMKGNSKMAAIKTLDAILTENKVSFEQVLKVTLENGGATVKSQSGGPDHQVRYNAQYRRLTCTCKAGQQGTPCWAQRAALAKLAIN